jgi:uncharacterized RDD family membrane protein YckC
VTELSVSPVPREARPYQGHTAGLITRSVAAGVDLAVVASVLLAGYVGMNAVVFLVNPRSFTVLDTHLLLSLTAGWVVAVIYLTGGWYWNGRTYGSHLMGLRVVSRRGTRLRIWVAFLRALFCTLVPIGLLWCAGSRQHRSIQDIVLRTEVIYDWQPRHEHPSDPTVIP